jgi:hypothetical protein
MDFPARWRRALDDYFLVALLACVVVAGAGGYLIADTYALETTETVQRERVVSSWTAAGQYDYGATVTEPNPVFETGERLTDRSQFFRRISPVVDGQFSFVYNASDGAVDVTVSRRTVLASVATTESDAQRTVWRVVTNETRVERADVGPGEPVTVPFAVDVNRTRNRTERIRNELGASLGEPRLAVRTNVTLSGTVDGREVRRSFSYALPIEMGESTYAVNASAAVTQREFERTETVVVDQDTGNSGSPLGAALFAVGIGGLAALLVGRRRGDLVVTEAERARLDYEAAREEYEEWISTVEVPPSFEERPRAPTDSLEDLVNVAIDVDERVFESRSDGTLYVPHGDAVLVYEPPDALDQPAPRGDRPAPPDIDATSGPDQAVQTDRAPSAGSVESEMESESEPDGVDWRDADVESPGDDRSGEFTEPDDDSTADGSSSPDPPTHGHDADVQPDADGSGVDRSWPSGSEADGATNGVETSSNGELQGPVGRLLDSYFGGDGDARITGDGDDEDANTEAYDAEHDADADDTGGDGIGDWIDRITGGASDDDTDTENDGDAGVPKQ